jgi:hypothetical protein
MYASLSALAPSRICRLCRDATALEVSFKQPLCNLQTATLSSTGEVFWQRAQSDPDALLAQSNRLDLSDTVFHDPSSRTVLMEGGSDNLVVFW